MTKSNEATRPRVRMRQEDRSRAMQDRLLKATLECLGEVGYAGMAIAVVAERAGVSRGAISHHYATKLELASAAMSYLFEARYERLHQALVVDAPQGLSIDQRLDIFRDEFSKMLPVNLEVINTLRTNAELREKVMSRNTPMYEERVAGYMRMFPEHQLDTDRSTFISVLVAFLRGLCIESLMDESPGDRINRMFEMFRRMVHLLFADAGQTTDRPPSAASQ